MTRKAKERRQERVMEKQRALERHLQREQTLSARSDWRALLHRIDGDDQSVVSPRHRVVAACPPPTKVSAVADTVQWKSTNVPVAAASVFELPVQVDAPRATLTYEFSTRDFDISFGIHAIGGHDGALYALVPTARYESHVQTVKGSLVLAGSTRAVLVWDNTFSWLNAKQLAYTIELQQEFPETPAPVVAPAQRAQLALHERAKRERLRTHCETSRAELESRMQSHDRQIEFIEHQIEELRKSLEATEALKVQAAQEKENVDEEIEALAWEIDALLWRSMGRAVIDHIFSFCNERDLITWSLTNHQWHNRIGAFRTPTVQAGSENDATTAA